MSYRTVMGQLESMGTVQNRRIYARHGVTATMYGVGYANLGKLKKSIGTDHDLAERLWASGNHDARVLATMVAEPARLDGKTLESWVAELDNRVLTAAFSGVASRAGSAKSKMRKWMKSRREWIGATGWFILAALAIRDGALSDDDCARCIETIEAGIHDSKNHVRYAMNSALIAIGLRNAALESRAVAAARKIGKIEVDLGETDCRTPDAATHIRKGRARRANR